MLTKLTHACCATAALDGSERTRTEVIAVLAAFLAMLAPSLPAAIGGPAPFPVVTVRAAADPSFVAPGVSRADYVLRTEDGPLVVHLVAVDPREPTVRLGAVLAQNRLISAGETVSAMAERTGAVAGINADYFDIAATNQPLNVLVRDGALLRSPSARAALWVTRDRTIGIGSVGFAGDVRWEQSVVPLTGVDVWPPQGGASLILPAYGARPVDASVATVPLAPVDPALGTYRVDAQAAPEDALLALGPAALANATPPPPGTTVAVRSTLDPPLAGITAAVGGGPQLVRDGAPFVDPNAPAPDETNHRFPLAGAGVREDGTLLLVAVDGRRPEESVGLTRPQFGALFLGLGAREATAFDSGGSATLVARVLGDAEPSVLNVPSDGVERPVADGLFVYSDAPRGTPDRLALRPDRIRALAGSDVRVEGRIVDAAGHAFGPARDLTGSGPEGRLVDGVLHVEEPAHSGELPVRAGSLRTTLPVDVAASLRTLRLLPAHPNPDPGGVVTFRAVGEDASGNPVATGGAVRFEASGGTIDAAGTFHAGPRDGVVIARAGGAATRLAVPVGRHDADVALFADGAPWRYDSAPHGAPGDVALAQGALTLDYDLTGATRASYAKADRPLPGEPIALALDVDGDASGVALRAAFRNRYGEPVSLTLAKRVDWNGWRRLRVTIPGTLNPPIVLTALYVVPALGGPPVRVAGSVQFRAVALVEPGTP